VGVKLASTGGNPSKPYMHNDTAGKSYSVHFKTEDGIKINL
jgi:hypothetical protein